MTIKCDGCGLDVDIAQIHLYTDYDHLCRYCADCLTEYKSFVSAAKSQEMVLQRQMDEWTLWARARMTLKLTPLDIAQARLPQIRQRAEGLILA